MNVRSIPVSGTGTTSAAGGPQPLIVLPQFPADGAWCVRGQVTAFEAVKDCAHSFAFNVAASGLTSGGVANETDGANPPYTVAPAPAGPWAGLELTLASATFPSGPVVTIAATLPEAPAGAEVVNWTWDLQVSLSDA